MNHTPEPWQYEYRRGVTRHRFNVPMSGENVRRAVACVNALAGVKNPAAVALLIQAVQTGDRHCNVYARAKKEGPCGECMDCALAALDQEPAP